MTNNFVMVNGKIGFEPKIFSTKKGGKMASCSLNVYAGKDKDGKAQYINLTVKTFDTKSAETIEMLGKGGAILVTGRLNVESYEKDGKKTYNTVIVANNVATAQ